MYDFEGLDLKPDEFEIYAYRALELIGNYWGETVTEVFKIENFVITLPEECEYIEQVTRTTEDFQMMDNVSRENYTKFVMENYVESRKRNKPILYQRGGFISYEQVGNSLKFKENNIPVFVDNPFRKKAGQTGGSILIDRLGQPSFGVRAPFACLAAGQLLCQTAPPKLCQRLFR